jgi:murein DD-endopeptidase MepM/ murein hydrolase activator NlpD
MQIDLKKKISKKVQIKKMMLFKKEKHTSGQVVQKLNVFNENHNYRNKINIDDKQDYYTRDSDNDGIADVTDVDDYNPDIQDYGDMPLKKDASKAKSNSKTTKENKFRRYKKSNSKSNSYVKKNKKADKKLTKKKFSLNFEEKKVKAKLLKKTGKAFIATDTLTRETIIRYNQVENLSDSDENSALQASDASAEVSKKILDRNISRLKHGNGNKSKKILTKNLERKSVKLKYDTKFEKNLKSNKIYQNSKGMNKYYQKLKLKKSYNQNIYGTYKQRIKKILVGTGNKFKEATMIIVRKVGVYALVMLIGMVFISTAIASFSAMLSNGITMTISTSYQADDLEITNAENGYNHFEADLLYAIDNVESDYPDYDEYRYYVDDVGHNPYELISYLTAEFGEFTAREVQSELSRIFDEQYEYQLVRKVERRHKTVTTISIDPITGETIRTSRRVSYNWYVLEIKLDTNSLEPILLTKLDTEEKELYETLIDTKGNFISFPSPFKEDWINSVSSMFGYRLDPITYEVEFHTGIDIAKPTGVELVSIFKGTVHDTGYNSELGKYVVLKTEDGETALYAHCNTINITEGNDVEPGQEIATVGSTGRSTGSHLHLEIRDSDGNRLNPYFYLSSEIADL